MSLFERLPDGRLQSVERYFETMNGNVPPMTVEREQAVDEMVKKLHVAFPPAVASIERVDDDGALVRIKPGQKVGEKTVIRQARAHGLPAPTWLGREGVIHGQWQLLGLWRMSEKVMRRQLSQEVKL
jgi:hypothetical protein